MLSFKLKRCARCQDEFYIYGRRAKSVNARIAKNLCPRCNEKLHQEGEILRAGGVMYKCNTCNEFGALPLNDETKSFIERAKKIMEKTKLPLVYLSRCPHCSQTPPHTSPDESSL